MSEKTLTIPFLPASFSAVPAVSWIKMEQAEIPLDQEIAKDADVYTMLWMSSLGQSARAYGSGRCPVTRSIAGDSVIARTTVSFYVHTSPNFDYIIEPSEGELSNTPFKVFRAKDEYIKTKYNEKFDLDWLPLGNSFSSHFATSCYDKKRKLVPDPEVVQDSGFVYVLGAVWSVLRVSGTGVCDKWTLTIEHEQGYRFDRSIFVDAVWYDGEERETERLELKLPGCVEAEFNKCPYESDLFGLHGDGQSEGSDHWVNYQLNAYSSARIVYNTCDGVVLEVYEDKGNNA